MTRAVLVLLALAPAALHAQGAAAPADSAAADSAARRAQAAQLAAARNRASWLSDRLPLRVGDLLTVVVDERTSARERTVNNATKDRDLDAGLNVNGNPANILGPAKEFGTGLDARSRENAEAARTGDLTGILTVRVLELDALGNAKVEGVKTVTVDGRRQELRLTGVVRADDVAPGNLVLSTRVADAVLEYKGKKMGPSQGILGKILSILWP